MKEIPTVAVDGKITTVYWNICGLGQTIRYALELAGADYVDVRVHWGPGEPHTPEYKKMWFDRKSAISESMPFANLPYLLDGEVALTQSNTVLRYLGRKFDLMGDASKTHIVDLILDQTADFDGQSTGLSYREGMDGLRPYIQDKLPGILSDWAQLLGEGPFMTGDTVTVADLKVYETFRKLRIIESELGMSVLSQFPTLMRFMGCIEELPAMKAYLESQQFMARPLNNEHAKFK